MSSIKNTSRYRFAKAKSNNENFTELRVSEALPNSTSLATSASFIAFAQGDVGITNKGNIGILKSQFLSFQRNLSIPVISAHDCLSDLCFNPFAQHQLYSSGRDGYLKLWTIPAEGLTQNLSSSTMAVGGFDGGINSIAAHSSAEGIVAVASKSAVGVVDMQRGAVVHKFSIGSGFGKDVQSSSWSNDGKLIASVGKDGSLHLIDPRTAQPEALTQSPKLELKAQTAFFLGSSQNDSLYIVGLDKSRAPQLYVYDPRNFDLSQPAYKTNMEFSTGVILPLYDVDTQLLFMGVRGSSMINTYDMSNGPAPSKIDTFVSNTTMVGCALSSKAVLNLRGCEVQRVLKLSSNTIESFSITVPRKEAGFHEDLYPDTFAGRAALSSEQWLAGDNAAPILANIVTLQQTLVGDSTVSNVESKTAAPTVASPSSSLSSSANPTPTSTPASRNVASPSSRNPEPEQKAEVKHYVKSETRKQIEAKFKFSMFQNVAPLEAQSQDKFYFDVAVDVRRGLALSKNLKTNEKFWAVPHETIGGSGICVRPLTQMGRVGAIPLVRGHKSQVTAFDLSSLQPNLLASGDDYSHVMVYEIPDQGLTEDLSTPIADFQCAGKITCVDFHPYVENVLVACATGFDGASVHFFDLQNKQEKLKLDLHPQPIIDVAFSPSGLLLATTCKDKKTRIIDPRANAVVKEFEPTESTRDTRVLFVDESHVLITGFGVASRRSASLWDLDHLNAPITTIDLETSNSTLLPFYDPDTQLLYVASNGSRIVRLYQISKQNIEFLSNYMSTSDLVGLSFRHKTSVNVRMAEIASCFFLHSNRVMPVSYKVPRKRLEYFQDDVYSDTRSLETLGSADDFFNGQLQPIKYLSMKPDNMKNLSEAPAEEMTAHQIKYQKRVVEQATPAAQGVLGTGEDARQHFRQMAELGATRSNRWDARREDSNDVDDSEWD